MNKITLSDNKYELYIIKYIWLLVIFPKQLQLPLMLLNVLLIIGTSRRLITKPSPYYLLIVVQLLAVIVQIFTGAANAERLMAAFNTMMIWIISIYTYFCITKSKYTRNDINKICNYVIFDYAVLFALFCIYSVSNITSISVLGRQLSLRRIDYMSGSNNFRFCALMETPLAPSHMYLCLIAISLILSSYNKKYRNRLFIFSLLGLISIFATHSRSGMLFCSIAFIIYVYAILKQYVGITNKSKTVIAILLVSIVIIFILKNHAEIIEKGISLFNARAGSDEARFTIYRESIRKALEESPIIGIGIKYMYNNFIPLGSHSTYIGIFYKTGFGGLILYILGTSDLWKNIINGSTQYSLKRYLCLILLCYFLFLVFADLDAMNWSILLAFTIWGLISNKSFINGVV